LVDWWIDGLNHEMHEIPEKHSGIEAALEQMPEAVVTAVEPKAVADVKPSHGPAQVGLRRLNQQMIMVVHQHVSWTRIPKRSEDSPSNSRQCARSWIAQLLVPQEPIMPVAGFYPGGTQCPAASVPSVPAVDEYVAYTLH
jgi:hypothetical protein